MDNSMTREEAHKIWRAAGQPTAAAAVVLDGSGSILIERGERGHKLPGLPGGKREPKESTPNTALRELLEETGVVGHEVTPFLIVQAGDHLTDIVWVRSFTIGDTYRDIRCAWVRPETLLANSRYPDVYAKIFANLVSVLAYERAK